MKFELAFTIAQHEYFNMSAKKSYELAKKKGERIQEEYLILECPYISVCYAKEIIKGRWIEAENIISINPECLFWYAMYVIKNKLPDDLHNKMIAYSLTNNTWAIDYFVFLKKKENYLTN